MRIILYLLAHHPCYKGSLGNLVWSMANSASKDKMDAQ